MYLEKSLPKHLSQVGKRSGADSCRHVRDVFSDEIRIQILRRHPRQGGVDVGAHLLLQVTSFTPRLLLLEVRRLKSKTPFGPAHFRISKYFFLKKSKIHRYQVGRRDKTIPALMYL